MCSADKQAHRTRRIITLQGVHGLQMEERYIGLLKMNSTTDSKTSKMMLSFLP